MHCHPNLVSLYICNAELIFLSFLKAGMDLDRMLLINELSRQSYKNKYGLTSLWVLNNLYVSISDPESARVVLTSCSDKWILTAFARRLFGNGSVFGEENIWRLRRKILTPLFSSQYFANFVQVFEKNNKIMIEEIAAVVGKGDFSIWPYFGAYSFDSALDMTFGENVNAQKQNNHPFIEAFEDYFKTATAFVCQPWLFCTALYRLLPAGARQKHNRQFIWQFIETLIRKKKMDIAKGNIPNSNNGNTSSAKRPTFLELLMQYSGGEHGYSDTELREETLVLVLAATDTTATAACFAAVLLASHPEVQDRVHEELQAIMGDSKRSVSVDDLPKLKYLSAVVKETLRLYPPAPVTLRICNKDVKLPSGLVLHKGSVTLLNIWGVHRNPHCWGADADQFKPERFLSASPKQLAAFMPFGYGPRSCTGTQLALASLKLSLAELTRRYVMTSAAGCPESPQTPLHVTFELMLKHVHRFQVRLENRV